MKIYFGRSVYYMSICMQYLKYDEKHQVESVKQRLQQVFQEQLYAIYLYGSYVCGGLKHKSDLDILVIIERSITTIERERIAKDLLQISVPIGHASARALEVTILDKESITTLHPPYQYQLQYGEWLRDELLNGAQLSSQYDPDLSILLKQAQLHHVAILGPNLNLWLPSINHKQIKDAIRDIYPHIIAHWKDDQDERNQILALCRIAYTLNKKTIAAKDIAAMWCLQFLDQDNQALLQLMINEYTAQGDEQNWSKLHPELEKIVIALQQHIHPLLFEGV